MKRHLKLVGDTTKDLSEYRGRHRDLDMDNGRAMIPLGDRNRVINEQVIKEDRDSDANIWRI